MCLAISNLSRQVTLKQNTSLHYVAAQTCKKINCNFLLISCQSRLKTIVMLFLQQTPNLLRGLSKGFLQMLLGKKLKVEIVFLCTN